MDHVWGVKSPSFFFLLCIHLPAPQLSAACVEQMGPPKRKFQTEKSLNYFIALHYYAFQ